MIALRYRMAVPSIEHESKGRCRVKYHSLSAIYPNVSRHPLALAFWWNRTMRIVDDAGRRVIPGPGPVLPCGVSERWQVVMPGQRCQRLEPLSCTQPAGQAAMCGWSYKLAPGTYGITLVFEAPPAHGFSQSESNEYAFRGRVESQQLVVELT
jgi:hypothetical protein